MTLYRRQRGYFLPDMRPLVFFMVVGLITTVLMVGVGLPALIYWLWSNFDVVRVR